MIGSNPRKRSKARFLSTQKKSPLPSLSSDPNQPVTQININSEKNSRSGLELPNIPSIIFAGGAVGSALTFGFSSGEHYSTRDKAINQARRMSLVL
jgi:hypothetical protein